MEGDPALRHADRQGPGARPQPGHCPPGHQAPQHHGAERRQRQGDGFWHCPGHEQEQHPDQGSPGLRPLYLPGTGQGRLYRQPVGHLFPQRCDVRDDDRAAPLRRGIPGGGGHPAHQRRRAQALQPEPQYPGGAGADHPQGYGAGAQGPVFLRHRNAPGYGGVPEESRH